MVPGTGGNGEIVTASRLATLIPQLFTEETVTFPEVGPQRIEMVVVPCPERMLEPVGALQV